MKKVIINLSLIVTFLITYFLQSNFFIWFKITGVMPNLFIILVLFIVLFMGRIYGFSYGIIFGIFLDLFIGKKVGITAIMLGIIGIFGGIFDKNFSKNSRITVMIMVVGCTIFYEIGMYILNYVMLENSVEIFLFSRTLFVEVIYNVILTIILYPLIQLVGHIIEDEFKGNKILTRYF